MVNGRRKGNDFENEVCIALSRWVTPSSIPAKPKLADLPFRRRSTSIMPLAGHWDGAGDILHRPSLSELWPFCVECKHVEGWSLDGALSSTWVVLEWWRQAERQARSVGLAPLLICGRNRRPSYAFLREGDVKCLRPGGPFVTIRSPDGPVVVTLLQELTATNLRRWRSGGSTRTRSST